MEGRIKDLLRTVKLKATGRSGGGCINEGEVFDTDKGQVFVKSNYKDGALQMFKGEMASLLAILETKTIHAPRPFGVVEHPLGTGAAIVMEALNMTSRGRHTRQLGVQVAQMHEFNMKQLRTAANSVHEQVEAVCQFGFDVTTCCGYLPMDNTWTDNWVEFYAQRRIEPQVSMAEKNGSREVRELWSQLQLKLPKFFEGVEVVPSLLHGDLWSGNKAETDNGPVIFDPASFYGHNEYEFGIINMFGGFSKTFFDGYYSVLPKQAGFEKRVELYELFHHLNHWNHFGSGYRSGALGIMRNLIEKQK